MPVILFFTEFSELFSWVPDHLERVTIFSVYKTRPCGRCTDAHHKTPNPR